MGSVQHSELPLDRHYGYFFAQFVWDWYATLTFGLELTQGSARRRFLRFVAAIQRSASQEIYWVRIDEMGSGGRVHQHALIGNVSELSCRAWQEKWNRSEGV